MLECSSIGIWELDFVEGKLVWDDQMLKIHGLREDEFRGIHNDWADRIHPDDRERMLAAEHDHTQLAAQQAKKKHIDLHLNVPFNLPAMEADQKRVRQILVNLLSNAVKFTPEGGQVTLDVKGLPSRDTEQVRLSVVDTGIGIEESKLETLFDPFVQVDTSLSREYEGTGLGLALVKQFTELHAGRLGVTSEVGVGSSFHVELPIRQSDRFVAEDSESDDVVLHDSPADLNLSKSFPDVLIVEDNELVAAATEQFLEACNFSIGLLNDGQSAIEAACLKTPDAILMDVQMRGMNGLEAIRHLRKNSGASEHTDYRPYRPGHGRRPESLSCGGSKPISKQAVQHEGVG